MTAVGARPGPVAAAPDDHRAIGRLPRRHPGTRTARDPYRPEIRTVPPVKEPRMPAEPLTQAEIEEGLGELPGWEYEGIG